MVLLRVYWVSWVSGLYQNFCQQRRQFIRMLVEPFRMTLALIKVAK